MRTSKMYFDPESGERRSRSGKQPARETLWLFGAILAVAMVGGCVGDPSSWGNSPPQVPSSGAPIADGYSGDYLIKGRVVSELSDNGRIWDLLTFHAADNPTHAVQFDGADRIIYSEAGALGDRARPEYFRLSRSGVMLTVTVYDLAGARLASCEIPTSNVDRYPGIRTYRREADREYNYHGFVGKAHDTDTFRFSLSATGDLVIFQLRHVVAPNAMSIGVPPIVERTERFVFNRRHGSS